jgi:hypothetical protein
VEELGGDVGEMKELWIAAREAEDQPTDAWLAVKPPAVLRSADFSTANVKVVASGGRLLVRVPNGAGVNEVTLNAADREALTALFAGYLRTPPRYDPHPSSYAAASKLLGWPRTTLVKRVEYVRTRLDKAGVPGLLGWAALQTLAEFAISCGIVTKPDVDGLDRQQPTA